MTEIQIPPRSEVSHEHTWNAESVFGSVKEWEQAGTQILKMFEELESHQGHLKESPAALLKALNSLESVMKKVEKVYVYAGISHAVDTTDQPAAGRSSEARSLYAKALAAAAFMNPEILDIGMKTLQEWMTAEKDLAIYQHYFDDLFRKQSHVRSSEVEELLGMLADPFSGVPSSTRMLTDADMQFKSALDREGNEIPVTQGTLRKIYSGDDREARRTAFENYADAYLAVRNALTTNLATSIKQNIFKMRARRHTSSLDAALFEYNIPTEVFHNLIDTFRENLPTWHRYWGIRRSALGVDTLHPYDMWAPLSEDRPNISYDQAVDWICEGLKPMGSDYVEIIRKGCREDRWVDVYPNQGKRAGAFSSGTPGTHPFIMMSYADTVFSLSTLAHELGHSMHSYLAWQHQPFVYGDYSIFVAEVASNFHQAMVRAYLLENFKEPGFQISVIEEAMANYYRYFFIMPTLARFELEMHQRVERGEGLTADQMMETMANLFTEGYGEGVNVDRDRVGIRWAQFGHLYVDYYVFQYATGISGANALASRIITGEENAVENYLRFLQAGGSVYPLEALQMAGVDLTSPDAVRKTFAGMAEMVDQLEELLVNK